MDDTWPIEFYIRKSKALKYFSNPEYMNAITKIKTKHKEVLDKYGKKPEFMMILFEFTKIMGVNLQKISEEDNIKLSKP